MGNSLHERLLIVVSELIAGNEISTRKIMDKYGIPKATAKRYIDYIEHYLPCDLRYVGRTRFLRLRK